jgi:hypothetical protein
MPYEIKKKADSYSVVNRNNGRVYGVHSKKAKAVAQLKALYANEKQKK